MPKRQNRQHHHSVRDRMARGRGLQLPDPLLPTGPGGPHDPIRWRIMPPGWRFRSAADAAGASSMAKTLLLLYLTAAALLSIGMVVVVMQWLFGGR